MTDRPRAEQALGGGERGEPDLAATDAAAQVAELTRVNRRLERELAERQRAEVAHGEELARLRLLVQQLPGFIWTTDRELRLTWGTGLTMREGSPSPSELVGTTLPELLGTDDPEFGSLPAHRAALGGVSSDIELQWLGREVRAQIKPLRNAAGEIVGTVGLASDITELKRAEAALRESEERFALAVEGSRDGVWDWIIEGPDIYLSPRWKAILGFTETEVGNELQEWISRIHPDDAELSAAVVSATLIDPTQHREVEYRLRHQDGSYRWVLVRGRAVCDAAGKPYRMVGSLTDITERKRVEEALRQSEENLQTIFASMQDIFFRNDLDDTILMVSPAVRQFGYEPDELIGHSASNFYCDPADQQRLRIAIFEHHSITDQEFALKRKDGSPVTVSTSSHLIFDRDGRPVGYEGILRDISDRKRGETALRESEERFQNAFRDAPTGMALLSFDTVPFLVNQALCEILGYSQNELLGRPLIDVMHPEDAPLAVQAYRRLSAGESETLQTESRYIHKLGQVIWAQIGLSLVRDRSGQPQYAILHVLDITGRRSFGEILRALNAGSHIGEVFAVVAAALRGLAGCQSSMVAVFDEHHIWGTILALDPPSRHLTVGMRLPMADSPAVPDVLAGRPHLAPDVGVEVSGSPISKELYHDGVCSTVCLPLTRIDGRIFGMLNLAWSTPGACLHAPLPVLQQVADGIALAVERSQLIEQVRSSHERLQQVSRELLKVQEAERRHLASELHDEFGQMLTAIKLTLGTLDHVDPTQQRTLLGEVELLVDTLVAQVRNLSIELRPAMLDDLGLLPALLCLCERYSQRTRVRVAFKHHGLGRRLAPEVETAAYRIVQESLTNVARYAQVDHARVSASADSLTLAVEVVDEGRGFDPGAVGDTSVATGLASMRERALLLGGRLTVESRPGLGTRVRAELPLGTETVERMSKSAQGG